MRQPANVELRDPIDAGKMVFGSGQLEPSLVTEPELVDDRCTENPGVTTGQVDLPLVVLHSETRESIRIEAIRVLEAETSEDRIFRRKLMIDAGTELVVIGSYGPSV